MSRHIFELTVDVDEAALAEHNAKAEQSHIGLSVGEDPSEWDDSDLAIARDEDIATVEITDYRSVDGDPLADVKERIRERRIRQGNEAFADKVREALS